MLYVKCSGATAEVALLYQYYMPLLVIIHMALLGKGKPQDNKRFWGHRWGGFSLSVPYDFIDDNIYGPFG